MMAFQSAAGVLSILSRDESDDQTMPIRRDVLRYAAAIPAIGPSIVEKFMINSLQGRVALVTGASRGVGRASAQ